MSRDERAPYLMEAGDGYQPGPADVLPPGPFIYREWKPRFAPDYDTCAAGCGMLIEPGDTVYYDGTGRQVHEDCELPRD